MKLLSLVVFLLLIVPDAKPQCNVASGTGLNECALSGIQVQTAGFSGSTSSVVDSATAQWNNCNNLGGATIPDFGSSGKASIQIELVLGNAPPEYEANWEPGGQSGTITLYTHSSSGSAYSPADLEYLLAHELGHALGLADVNDKDCLMHQNTNSRTRSVRTGDCTSTNSLWESAANKPGNDDCINQLKTYGDCNSPIVIDLGKNGFSFGGPEGAIYYDLLGVGKMSRIQWVAPNSDDVFLTHDTNGNGLIDDGSELFGNGTRMILENNRLAKHGFEAMAQWDLAPLGGNGNGVIDVHDAVWEALLLWQDKNADGISQNSELSAPSDMGLTRVGIFFKETPTYDEHYNILKYWGKAFKDSQPSKKFHVVDVFFKPVPE